MYASASSWQSVADIQAVELKVECDSRVVVKMPIKNVCRLCLTDNDLVWIFDKQFDSSKNMPHVIYITTGVKITVNDVISQKICQKCRHVTNQMFEFRKTSLRNDQHLKEQCKMFLNNKEKIRNNEVTIRDEEKNSSEISDKGGKISPKKDSSKPKKETKVYNIMHPSVRAILRMHPQIKLPTGCLKYNMDPCISMKMDQVEQYFKSRKLDIQKYVKLALRSGKRATTKNCMSSKIASASKIIRTKDKVAVATKENSLTSLKINPHPPLSNENIVQPDSKCKKNNFIQNIEEQSSSNKRKCVEGDTTEKKEAKKCNIIECLKLVKFKLTEPSVTEPSYVANKSVPLFMCQICNSVQYNAKDLKKHQKQHLWCQLCKMKFRSLENKEEHLNSMCLIKNLANNLPDIKLQKVEFNNCARRSYPNAFKSFSPLHNVEDSDINVTSVESSEVVEIFSDDEEFSRPTPNAAQSPHVENIVYSTVSIVRPNIKLKDNRVWDMVDTRLTDLKILKQLLIHYRPAKVCVEKSIQTELPVNESISLNRLGMKAQLKLLKPQLHVYKVPIVIKNGIFNVSYNYTVAEQKQKKMCLWNGLNVIDIKPSNVKTSTKVVPTNQNVNNRNIMPSTRETYNSNKVSTRPTQLIAPTTSNFFCVNASFLSPVTTASRIISPPSISNATLNPQINNTTRNTFSSATVMTPIVNKGRQFGNIRVKNVWELT